ncbi:hypothetical protein [Streptomyces sp. NBC_01431]|uniref:hypothetical protein n=1 Tax=Streptomyces sp. NBC_01431 TaxID=2903863 RepID=UPI002E32541D|nr:hypothetical protein [Streptomyces sp. NBC_01431]
MTSAWMGVEAADGFPHEAFEGAYHDAVVRTPGIYSADLQAGADTTEVKTQIATALHAVVCTATAGRAGRPWN